MSLTKLFNYKFFIQNIKKSKSGIIFATIILPIFTVLTMLLFGSDSSSRVMDFTTLSIFNIFLMYFIPVVLSISLFSYVFKKNSSDFIGSMPISRKTIFTTNTIGGIILILMIQIVTAIFVLLTSLITKNIILFGSMVWDVFVYFTISYIFVFIACNLAMSFSGNMFATIAATMLILFFVPFLLFVSRSRSTWSAYSYYNYLNKDESNNIIFYDRFNFTAPSYIMDCMANGVEYEFNVPSMIKMVGLSCIYFFIGLKLFDRKKFEMAGESYENDTIHLIIKFLSLAPFFALGIEGEIIENPISFMFFFAVVAAYYFLFDIITKKKIKISKTLITYFAFSAMMYVIFALIVPQLEIITKHSVSIDEVEDVTIASISTYSGNEILANLKITDSELIYGMLTNVGSTDNYYSGFTGADLIINTNNGHKYNLYRADIPNIKKILNKYGSEKYDVDLNKGVITLGGVYLNREDENALKDAIKKDLEGISYNKLYSILQGDREIYALLSTSYIDHRIIINTFNSSDLDNTFKETVRILNNNAYKHATEYDFANMTYMSDFRSYIISLNPEIRFEDYEEYDFKTPIEAFDSGDDSEIEWGNNITDIIFDGLRNIEVNNLREYLYEHKDDNFDRSKSYYSIWFVTTDGGFYSNDLEGLYRIFAKEFNEKASVKYGIKLKEL